MSTLAVSHTLTRLHVKPSRFARAKISPRRDAPFLAALAVLIGVFALLGAGSLGLANVTLSLQEERAGIRQEIQETHNAMDALNLSLAEHEGLMALKTAAEALGFVPEGRIVFLDATPGHLTRQ